VRDVAFDHHTKAKGDLGVAKAHADLVGQGYLVLFPASEHAPFDLVAYADGRFARIQVKYRTIRRGVLTVHFRGSWADSRGVHTQPMDKAHVDLVCVYSPELDQCFYVRPEEHRASVSIRVEPARNGQSCGVQSAQGMTSARIALNRAGTPD